MADYSKNTWVDHTTPLDASHMNHLETEYDTAKAEYQAGNWGGPPVVLTTTLSGRITLAMMTDAASGYFLKGQGIGSNPVYAALAAADIPVLDFGKITTGTVPVTQGGTGNTTIAAGAIPYATSLNTFGSLAPTTSNQVLRSTGANALQISGLVAADIPSLDSSILTSGTIDGSRLPAMSATKTGGVPLTGAPSGQMLYDTGWGAPPGSGDVSSIETVAVDNEVVRMNGTTGKSIQKSLMTIDDSGTVNIPTGQLYKINGSQHTHAGTDITSGRIALTQMTDGTAAQYLRAGGAGIDPAYATPTFTEMAAGQITLAQAPRGTLGQVIYGQGAGSSPIYAALTSADWSGRVTAAQLLDGTANYFLAANGAGSSPAYRALAITDIPTITPAYGGTGQTTVPTKGDIPVGGSNILNLLGVGADGLILTANAASAYGVKWAANAGAGVKTIYASNYATFQLACDAAAAAGAKVVLDKSFTGHTTLTNAVHAGLRIEGIGEGLVTLTGDDANPVLACRASNVTMSDFMVDGNNTATAGVVLGDVPGAHVNSSVKCNLLNMTIQNCNGPALQFDDQTYYINVHNVRMLDGNIKGVYFNHATGATGDNGQTNFIGCEISATHESVLMSGTAGTRHRITFLECGFQGGQWASSWIADFAGIHDLSVITCDFEGSGGAPPVGFCHLGGQGQSLINCNFYGQNYTNQIVIGANGAYSPYVVQGCVINNFGTGSYGFKAYSSATHFAGAESTVWVSWSGTAYQYDNLVSSQHYQTVGNTAGIPTSVPSNLDGEVVLYHDTQAAAYYLLAKVDGVIKKVALT